MEHPDLYLELLTTPEPSWEGVLGAALFSGEAHSAPAAPLACPTDLPLARVSMPLLDGHAAAIECWRIAGRTRTGSHGAIRYAHGDEFLFGSLHLPEEAPAAGHTGLERATERAYREMHATLEANGFAQLLRVWNYLPDINLESRGTERYRQFNSARQEALLACGRDIRGNVPAASALGSASGPLSIYFLAGRAAPAFIENPRQVSAYHYPAEYGPRAPSFSRAALVRHRGATLFISGTSSILGHRTLHEGDPAAQTRETLTNIEALIGEANRLKVGTFRLDSLAYKVYVRNPEDLPLIRAEMDCAVGPRAPRVYLRADVCRRDLSMEIEAVGQRA